MRAEEREDALAGILRRSLLVSGSYEPAQDREQGRRLVPGAFMVVEEPVPGLRVFLHVMLDRRLRGIKKGTSHSYTISAAEEPGTGFQTAPRLGEAANPETIHFG